MKKLHASVLVAGLLSTVPCALAQPFDIYQFDPAAQGPWSDFTRTTLVVPKVPNGSVKLDGSASSAEYGGFQGITVTPGDNAWILDFPGDRTWDGPEDSSFTYWLAHDDENLYVGVHVKDDVVNTDDPNTAFWKDDAIEIVVDALNDRLDTNTDASKDPFGGHCYVNFEGRFSAWDDAGGVVAAQTWSSAVDWSYGASGDVFGFGKAVAGGWQMEARLKKRLFESPDAGNKLKSGYIMGFNIGLDDDDKNGLGLNGNQSRTQDLEIQYFWANRQRRIGLTPDVYAALTPEEKESKSYLENYPLGIDSTGRLTHGGTGEIIFAEGQPCNIFEFQTTAEGPWSDATKTTLEVPKVANGSVKLDASPSSAEYGGFQGVAVTPCDNAWLLDYPADRSWGGANDSSFTFWLAHDETYFYVGVDVLDDAVNSDDPNDAFWKDDAIEIVVDALNDRVDNNTDNSNDKYGGHCYVNYEGRFSAWDDAAGSMLGQRWSSGVTWNYGESGEVFGVGKEANGGWKMELRLAKKLFENPDAKNKLDNGYVMGFNIGLDDDDLLGPGPNGNGTRTTDLDLQYFWANRARPQGLTQELYDALTPEQKASKSYLNDYPKVIDSNGRLAHGGTGEIKFVSAASPVPQLAVKLAGANVEISWTGGGTLQESTSVTGPWAASADQTTPQLVPHTGPARFYRVRR